MKRSEQSKWKSIKPRLERSRAERGIGHCVRPEDEDAYTLAKADIMEKLKRERDPLVPAMPVIRCNLIWAPTGWPDLGTSV